MTVPGRAVCTPILTRVSAASSCRSLGTRDLTLECLPMQSGDAVAVIDPQEELLAAPFRQLRDCRGLAQIRR